ncbi:MAG: hypothetical protein QHI38_10015 [Armatimonadota bacterium]|nr:hypothetical protein [Armatimonadota bacterium]
MRQTKKPLAAAQVRRTQMGKETLFDYARLVAQAEQRFLELLERADCRELASSECPDEDLANFVRPRPDSNSSG